MVIEGGARVFFSFTSSYLDNEAILTLEDDGDGIHMSFSDIVLDDSPNHEKASQRPTKAGTMSG